MPTNLPSIADVIERALSWEIHDASVFKVIASTKTTEMLLVSNEDLALVHPYLADALRAQIQWREQTHGDAVISGVLASATLDVLSNKYINLKYRHGTEKFFAEIDDVNVLTETVHLVGTWVSTITTHSNGNAIRFATGRYTVKHAVPADLLEENFPDWERRWTIAIELGLESDERMHYVFASTTPSSAINLPDISLS